MYRYNHRLVCKVVSLPRKIESFKSTLKLQGKTMEATLIFDDSTRKFRDAATKRTKLEQTRKSDKSNLPENFFSIA